MKIVVGVLVLFSSLRMLVHGYLIPQTLVVVPLLVLAVSLVSSWMLHSTPPSMQENRGGRALQGPRSARPDRAATGGTQRISRAERIVAITQAWCESWTGAELIAALVKRGCLLARGDQ